MIPAVAERGLAEFCDVYCDDGYYTVAESRRILEAGRAAGLRPKIHTDAYSDIGGAAMAAELGVVSADHLNYTGPSSSPSGWPRRAWWAWSCPRWTGPWRTPRPFDAPMLADQGLTLALATDLCPACWAESMQFVMQLACRLYRFSPEAALLAATAGGAARVGARRPGRAGGRHVGRPPDLGRAHPGGCDLPPGQQCGDGGHQAGAGVSFGGCSLRQAQDAAARGLQP